MSVSKLLTLAALAASGLLAGCQSLPPGGGAIMAAPIGPVAQITAISPDTSKVLHPGQAARMKVEVGYVLAADSGTLSLIVLDAENAGVAHDFKEVKRGSGSATLEADFTVPRTSVIRVYTSLIVKDHNGTSGVDGRAYEVVAP